jgi:bloom syndrome protein
LKARFPNIPILALTATATIRVRHDVVNLLNLNNVKWFLTSFDRPNLRYTVLSKKGLNTVIEIIIKLIIKQFQGSSGIIYCLSRKDCETTADKLNEKGIKACAYHAGLNDKIRNSLQKDWLTDKFRIMCATNAFGMGINR